VPREGKKREGERGRKRERGRERVYIYLLGGG
jgi:hypothetical protein